MKTIVDNANIQSAIDTLKGMGVPVLDKDLGWNADFYISGEDNYNDGETLWADYYEGEYIYPDSFGIHPRIMFQLNCRNMHAEWINPGLVGIYLD